MAGAYETIDEQLGEYLTYDAEATCTQRFPMSRTVCLQDDGDFAYCDDEEEEEEEDAGDDPTGDNDDEENNNNDDGTSSDDENDNNSGNDDGNDNGNDGEDSSDSGDSNDDGDNTSPPNEESSAARGISMGTLPMLLFRHIASILQATGFLASR